MFSIDDYRLRTVELVIYFFRFFMSHIELPSLIKRFNFDILYNMTVFLDF